MPHETRSSEPHQVLRWMNSGKWTLARPRWILWTCLRSVSGLSGEGVRRCGHSVVWSSGFAPSASLCQCICFQMGLTQAWDVPCWGPLKPETLEVDVCLCPVCSQEPPRIQGLQMWPAAWRHSGHSRVSRLRPCPRRLGPPHTHHHHLYHANHQQPPADQGADHPGLVSNPCLHLP